MAETFTSATTKIEDLASKKDQIIDKVASLLAEAIISRKRDGNLNMNTERDIYNALKRYSDTEKTQILIKVSIYVGMNTTRSSDSDDNYRNSRSNAGKRTVRSRSDLFSGDYDN